jgi:hypothetical protein
MSFILHSLLLFPPDMQRNPSSAQNIGPAFGLLDVGSRQGQRTVDSIEAEDAGECDLRPVIP